MAQLSEAVLKSRLTATVFEKFRKHQNVAVFSSTLTEQLLSWHVLVDTMTALARIQEKIVEAVQSVNNCSGYGIPLITLSCLLHLIVTPYFLLTEIMRKDRNMCFISLQSVWILAHIGRLLIIVEPCQQCLDEQQKTSLLLCELLSSNSDENVKNLFAIFAVQLKCCKIEFTSCGFFKINRSLLTSVAGAVTTYLVILFQFNTN